MPGRSSNLAAGLASRSAVICRVTSPSSLSAARMRLASWMGSARATPMESSSARLGHAAIWLPRVVLRVPRAPMPRSTTRGSAISALIASGAFVGDVVARGDRAPQRSVGVFVAARQTRLCVLQWESCLSDATCVEGVGLAEASVGTGVSSAAPRRRCSWLRLRYAPNGRRRCPRPR